MKKIFTLLILLSTLYNYAQIIPGIEWQRSVGSDDFDSSGGITTTTDGGYITFGTALGAGGDITTSYGGSDYWIAKLDADGTIEWQRSYGGSSYDGAGGDLRIETAKIRQTPDGGYILGANTGSSDGDVSVFNGEWSDVWLVKIDSSGNIEWEKSFGTPSEEYFSDIKVTDEGGFIMTYVTSNWNTLIFSSTVTKLDALGNVEWSNSYGSGEFKFSFLYSIFQTSDGGYIATGHTDEDDSPDTPANEIFPGFNDPTARLWVLKISASGALDWAKTYGGTDIEEGYCIVEDTNGNYVVSGMSYSGDGDVIGHPNPNNVQSSWILKLDNSGGLLWQKTFGQASGAYNVRVMTDGNYAIGGSFYSDMEANGEVLTSLGGTDQYLKKLDQATGNAIWTKRMGGTKQDILWNFELTPDGGFITTGNSISTDGDVTYNNGSYDYWVVKLGPDCLIPVITAQPSYTACAGDDVTLTAASEGNTINWYATGTSTPILFTGADYVIPAVTAGGSYWVEALSSAGCTSERVEVTVAVNPLPILTVATTAYSICENTTATLTASTTAGNDIEWYYSADAATPIASGTDFTTPALTANTSYWVGAASPESCVSARTEIIVTVNPLPVVTVDATVSVCDNTAAVLTASAETGNVIAWYDSATATTPLVTGAELTTSALTANTSYWVEASNPLTNCISGRTEVTVTVNPLPVLTVDTTSYTICENTTAVLTAGTAAGNLIVWYDSANGTQQVATGAEFTTPQLAQNTSYWVAAYNPVSHCVSGRTEITITVTPASSAVTGFNYDVASVCMLGDNPTLVPDNGFTPGGTFSSTAGLSIDASTGAIDLSSSTAGTYTVTYTVAASGCMSGGSHSATITITDTVSPVVSFSYGEVCTNDTYVAPVLGSGFFGNGTFSSASGISVDAGTGEINVAASQPGTYVIVYEIEEDSASCQAAGRFETEVVITNCQIQRGISPNGDNLNDWFDLTGVGVDQLSIFNRYGTEIYAKSGYVKEWGGQDKSGNDLPDGTYFYAIKKTSGDQLTGWVYINRAH